jgi:peptide/nickel transport system substrate-binding protein
MERFKGIIWQMVGLSMVLFVMLLPAVTSAESEKPQYGGVLKIIDLAEGAQPIGAPWAVRGIDSKLQKPVLEGLLREDAQGNYHPWLATSWDIDQVNNTITVFLRKGVKFHDGTDFNAEASKFVIDRSIAEKMARGFNSVDVIDEHTIRINTEPYQNNFLNTLASSPCNPVSPTAYKTMGEEKAKWNPVGTGAFKFVSFERGDKLTFTKWDRYWQKGRPYLDGVEYLFIRDPMTQQAAMRARGAEKVHVLSVTAGEQAAMMKAQGFEVLSWPIGPISLIPDSKNANSPLSKRKVRQAISYAIDREAICKARGFGYWQPANQIPSPGNLGYVKDMEFGQYNPEKAKKLLAEAGYPNGFKITIHVMPAMVDRDAMVAVQRFLGELGIQVELEFPDGGGYTALRWKDGWTNGLMAQHTRMLATFNITYNFYWNTPGQWPSLTRTEGLIDAIETSLKTLKPEDEWGQKLTRMQADDAMIIPLYYVPELYVLQPEVHDTGYCDWSASTVNTPETTWLSK